MTDTASPPIANGIVNNLDAAQRQDLAQAARGQPVAQTAEHHEGDDVSGQAGPVQHAGAALVELPPAVPAPEPPMATRPGRVTTDGHGSYPGAIRSVPGKAVRHRTSACLNNRIEQDHRGIKGRIRCMRGFKSPGRPTASAGSTANSGIFFVPAVVTTSLSPPPFAATASHEAPALRSGSCRTRDPASFSEEHPPFRRQR